MKVAYCCVCQKPAYGAISRVTVQYDDARFTIHPSCLGGLPKALRQVGDERLQQGKWSQTNRDALEEALNTPGKEQYAWSHYIRM